MAARLEYPWTRNDVGWMLALSLLVAIISVGVAYGSGSLAEARVWLDEERATPATCAEYLRSGFARRWVALRECYVDPQTSLIVEGNDARRIAALRGSPAPGGETVLLVHTYDSRIRTMVDSEPGPTLPGPIQVSGVVYAGDAFLSRRKLNRLGETPGLRPDFMVMEHHGAPLPIGVIFMVALWLGCTFMVGAGVRQRIIWRVRRKRWEEARAAERSAQSE